MERVTEVIGEIMRLRLKLLPEGQLPYAPDRNSRDVGTGFDEVRLRQRGRDDDESDDEDESEDEDFALEDDSEDSTSEQSAQESEQTEEEEEEEPSSTTPELLGVTGIEALKTSNPTSTAEAGSSTSSMSAAGGTSSPIKGNPPLSFIGTSDFLGTFANSQPQIQNQTHRSIRGTVSMTPDNEVHWQYMIRYSGRDQWLMNGIQIGGPKSRYGVVGVWSTADHDPAGPCGPFWYFPHFEGEAKS